MSFHECPGCFDCQSCSALAGALSVDDVVSELRELADEYRKMHQEGLGVSAIKPNKSNHRGSCYMPQRSRFAPPRSSTYYGCSVASLGADRGYKTVAEMAEEIGRQAVLLQTLDDNRIATVGLNGNNVPELRTPYPLDLEGFNFTKVGVDVKGN